MGRDSKPQEMMSDIVVVGGGGAGLAAAAEAARQGLATVLLEKAGKLGGTTALSVGSIMAAGGRHQKRLNIEDSPAAHAQDLDNIRRAMGFDDDPALRQLLTENVAETIEFLESTGINFLAPLPQPPHTKSRLHQVMPTSRAYVSRLERYIRRGGVDVRLNAAARRLITDNGRVAGVEASFQGLPLRVMARRGVILTSGDIGGDPAKMYTYMKGWLDNVEVYNPLNTGDGHDMAAQVGARIVARKDLGPEAAAHIRFVQPPSLFVHKIPPYPIVTKAMIAAIKLMPEALIRPFLMKFLTTTLGPDRGVYEQGAILVNKCGDRFADEVAGANIFLPQQPEGLAYIVFDARFARKFSKWPHFISTAPGIAFAFVDDYRRARPDLFTEAASLDQLAAKVGFSPDRLRNAVAAINKKRSDDRKLVEPPFYALGPAKLWVMVAPIGIAVNTNLEVLNSDGRPIPGLYAAGNAGQAGFTVTGHGHGLGWAFTSGRLAARSAAASARLSAPQKRAESTAF
jgi:succinate dehydrogenase/fumarate reductase flavoprotein subunit